MNALLCATAPSAYRLDVSIDLLTKMPKTIHFIAIELGALH